MKYEMPALTEQQKAELIDYLSCGMDYSYQDHKRLTKLIDQIALAALTAEPELRSYWFDAHLYYQEARFGRPMLKNGKEVLNTFYTAPPVPVPVLKLPEEMSGEQACLEDDYYGDPIDVFARGANCMLNKIKRMNVIK